jgi:hypothetical protein
MEKLLVKWQLTSCKMAVGKLDKKEKETIILCKNYFTPTIVM